MVFGGWFCKQETAYEMRISDWSSDVCSSDLWEMAGVNSRAELALVEAEWQRRRRLEAMADGVTLVAPDTVWFAHDTVIGRDCVVEPNVVFGPGVRIADGVTIRAFSHIEGADIAKGAGIGSYARLRPRPANDGKAQGGTFVGREEQK